MKKINTQIYAEMLEKWGCFVILGILLAFMLLISCSAFLQTSYLNTNDISGENIDIYSDNVFLNMILLVLYISAIYLFAKCTEAINARRMELVLYGWMLLFGGLFIVSTKLAAPVYSDSFILTNAAMEAAEGYYGSMENYFVRFPFQLGYVLYCEVFFRVVLAVLPGLPEGYYFLALQGINLLWLMLSYFALLRILELFDFGVVVSKICMLLMFFAFQPVMSCTFLYGNLPGFALGTLAVWLFLLFIKKGWLHYALLCALCLGLAVTLKLNLMIFLVAIGCIWLVELVKKFSLKSLVCLALCIVSVLTVSKLPQSCYENRSGYDFGEGIPMTAWLAMGMSEGHAAAGWYKEDNTVTAFKESGNDPQATGEKAKQVISQRVGYFASQPAEALRFFSEKLRSQWNEPSYDSIWLNQVFLSFSQKGGLYTLCCDKGEKLTMSLMNQHQQMVMLGMLLGVIALFKKRDILSCILPLIILGGFMYHMLFEAKSQYALPYFILMLPVAAYGLAALFERMKKAVA